MSTLPSFAALRARLTSGIKRLGKKRLVMIAVCICLVIVAAVAAVLLRAGGTVSTSAEDTARAALDAYLSFDSKKMLSLFPEEYVSFAAEKYYGGSTDGFEQLLRSNAAENRSDFEARYGSWSYSEVTVKSSREYSDSQLSALNEDFDALGLRLHARAAIKLRLGYSLSYITHDDIRNTEVRTYDALVIKVGSRWYLFDE